MQEGSSVDRIFRRLNELREKPSMFQVRIFIFNEGLLLFTGFLVASEESELSEDISLKYLEMLWGRLRCQ